MTRRNIRFAPLIFSAMALVGALGASPAIAQYVGPSAGTAMTGSVVVPSAMPHIATIGQALNAPDDAMAVIEGYIVNRLRHEHYTFRDDTGRTIVIELDDKYLPPGHQINDKTRVRITGEVDRHHLRANDIDVKRIEILQ
ncbi:YgiW/YdeI family stress tolerance OB fold protein [Pandoraea terrigena]|uniref:Stress-induced protein YgiW n=1 Tax=Pandoraea terrigena TaxID=2508292 RepID=A0A5E4VJT7_9BURK|nr:NirD/YgiW/YdeI family stress tolerance protein [Pandoraea terrigena]VVE11335.1 stress-induced protein YgiW [Pandoraea terrigena]